MASTLSGQLMLEAKTAYFNCIRDRILGNNLTTEDNNYSIHAISVYILSVTALEAFINEVCFGLPFGMSSRKASISDKELNELEYEEICEKYYRMPQILWGNTFDKGTSPYQDFAALVRLRNDFVHYKMKELPRDKYPRYYRWLEGKGILLDSGKKPGFGFALGWFCDALSTKTAWWAYNTACKMANKLIEISAQETKAFWETLTADNFKEIPEQYWKTLVPDSK